jgi:Na+/proline symporter
MKEKKVIMDSFALGLTGMGILLGFMAFIGRADSMEDVSRGKFFDFLLLGPVWGTAIFMYCDCWFRERRGGRIVAVLAGLLVWIGVAAAFSAWEQKKIDMRLEHLEQISERIDASPEQTPSEVLAETAGPRGVTSAEENE